MRLTFINHACCRIEAGPVTILTDPWIEGPVFNQGWDLLIPTPMDFDRIMEGVTHVWISHEHPDHFAVPFMVRAAKTHRDRIAILFQKTRDRRVADFCEKQGLRVIEMPHGETIDLGSGVRATCHPSDFYDSWLHLSDGQHSLLNLNDCPIRNERGLIEVAKKLPAPPTVLLTQFSYAAWKGGRDNRAFRAFAAREKSEIVALQARILKPAFTVPFASFVYFSNVENDYLNDSVNTPRDAARAITQGGSRPLILHPGDTWTIGDESWDNERPLERYDAAYARLASLPKRDGGRSASLDELRDAYRDYRSRIRARNSPLLLRILRLIPGLGALRPIPIRLWDTGARLRFSVLDGLTELGPADPAPEVAMHSSSLLYILKNEFGYDTLTVNGRFEATPAGFADMTRSLAIGSLNAMGLSISLGLLANPRIVTILLDRLRGVMRRLQPAA